MRELENVLVMCNKFGFLRTIQRNKNELTVKRHANHKTPPAPIHAPSRSLEGRWLEARSGASHRAGARFHRPEWLRLVAERLPADFAVLRLGLFDANRNCCRFVDDVQQQASDRRRRSPLIPRTERSSITVAFVVSGFGHSAKTQQAERRTT